MINRILAILQQLRLKKEYKLADELKAWIEDLFKIEISFTKESVCYNKRHQ